MDDFPRDGRSNNDVFKYHPFFEIAFMLARDW
jgi:hypothetical protein